MKRYETNCKVCAHPDRPRIELLLAGGASVRSVARKFGLNYSNCWRHWKHVPDERKASLALGPVARAALAARVSEESASVIDHLKVIRCGLYTLYDAAVEAGDRSGGALLAGRLIECCNSVGKITGELAHSPLVQSQTNIFISPQFAELQSALIKVLSRFPEARAAVIQEFRSLESKSLPSAPVVIDQSDVSRENAA